MKGTTKSLGQKDLNDKFYTKPTVAKQLIDNLDLQKYDLIIEPSAGNGSFSKNLPNCLALDLFPEDKSILQQDFFSFVPPKTNNCLVIGNPPFGQQSKLAIAFFRYAASFANTIAFILPKSFKKYSIQNRLPLNFHLEQEYELPKNSFTLMGQDYDVPCVFQIWDKKEKEREKYIYPMKTSLFTFTKNPLEAHFRVQRVGGSAGKAFTDKNGAISSNYYLINTSDYNVEYLVNSINSIEFPSISDTVGPKSLPKGEFIYEIEYFLQKNKEEA